MTPIMTCKCAREKNEILSLKTCAGAADKREGSNCGDKSGGDGDNDDDDGDVGGVGLGDGDDNYEGGSDYEDPDGNTLFTAGTCD